MTHEIYSNVSSSMQKIYEAHWETGNEISSKNGKAIAFAQRARLESKQTPYDIEYKDGKRRIVKRNTTRNMGTIVNKKGTTLTTRLSNLIQWRTYSTTGTTVVAGMFKQGYTEVRKDGKVVDRTKVDPIGKGTINILQKLNYGLNEDSSKVNKVGNPFTWDGGSSMPNFRGTHTRALNFAEEGRRDAMDKVNSNIKKGFSEALARRERFAKTKMEKVS